MAQTITVNPGDSPAVLQQDTLLYAQSISTGEPANLIAAPGADTLAQQVIQGANASLDNNGFVTQSAPGFWNTAQGQKAKALGQVIDNTGKAASVSSILDFPAWIETHAANFSLIAFGAVIAVAALIYSQKENITTVAKQVGKVAAIAT